MSFLDRLGQFAKAALKTVTTVTPTKQAPRRPDSGPGARPTAPAGRPPAGAPGDSPGRTGAAATVEVDPRRIGAVRMTYNPVTDGDPDPGEVIWTWVPFEERDGRGKDRPVLVVASEATGGAGKGTVLAVQLTSKDHGGERDFVPVGTGRWDSQGRPSWVNLDRVFRVHPGGMRREACALPADRFVKVAAALQREYGWTAGK